MDPPIILNVRGHRPEDDAYPLVRAILASRRAQLMIIVGCLLLAAAVTALGIFLAQHVLSVPFALLGVVIFLAIINIIRACAEAARDFSTIARGTDDSAISNDNSGMTAQPEDSDDGFGRPGEARLAIYVRGRRELLRVTARHLALMMRPEFTSNDYDELSALDTVTDSPSHRTPTGRGMSDNEIEHFTSTYEQTAPSNTTQGEVDDRKAASAAAAVSGTSIDSHTSGRMESAQPSASTAVPSNWRLRPRGAASEPDGGSDTPRAMTMTSSLSARLPRAGSSRQLVALEATSAAAGTTATGSQRISPATSSSARPLAGVSSSSEDRGSTNGCAICLERFVAGDAVRLLRCLHSYHRACIDPWLRANAVCPVCKMTVRG